MSSPQHPGAEPAVSDVPLEGPPAGPAGMDPTVPDPAAIDQREAAPLPQPGAVSPVPDGRWPVPEPGGVPPVPEPDDAPPVPEPDDTPPVPEPDDAPPVPEPDGPAPGEGVPVPEPGEVPPVPEPDDAPPVPEPDDTPPVPEPDDVSPAGRNTAGAQRDADLIDGEDAEDGEDADESGVTDRELPELRDDAELEAALEALLLVVDAPVEVSQLATAVDMPVATVDAALRRLADRYAEQQRGIDLRGAGGGWRLYTRDRYAPFVEKLLLDGQRAKLTRAALETLAVVAYRQPVTRSRVAAVRGVNVDGVIRTLLARGLVEETGTDAETGGLLYRTTELFLERLGLSSLEDLPPIAPLLPEVDSIDDV